MPYDPDVSQCPSCSNPIPTGSRFCPTCGFALQSASIEERRVVTVLFADLVGFTSLAEYKDPEQVKRMIDACFKLLVDDITTFGGTVDKLVGDGIVALFGVPFAHEDDAERGVRAALRMQESLADFSAHKIAPNGMAALQMRVGINTGVALVGTVAGTDHTAMGDVVNTASRLQTLAPPGGILVGDSTRGLTQTSIEYEAAGDLTAKGRVASVPAWLARSAFTQPGARHRRRDVAIMGRSTELALARAALDFSVMNAQAVLIAVDGEGGVGKSRLIDELIVNARDGHPSAVVLEGSAVPYGQSNRWWPLANALFDRLELDVATSVDIVLDVARERVRELFGDDGELIPLELADVFLHLLGYPSKLDEMDAQAVTNSVFRGVTVVLERLLDAGPVMLSMTDVHWADPAVLALFEHLVVSLARKPFILVTTNRPDPELVWPPLTSRAAVVRLPLESLGQVAAAQMCRAIIGADADDETIAKIYERSGGNPLFLEELAVLVAEGGDVTALPDSLRAVIAARLDQLPTDQRATLDNAAVLGPSGAVSSLARFAEALGGELNQAWLAALHDKGLLCVDGLRWSFKSDSVREVAYNTLTKAIRAGRHVGVAMAMESKGNPDDVAHHLATAAEIVAELGPIRGVPADIRERALAAIEVSVERASDQGNLRQIARACGRAVALFPQAASGSLARRLAVLRLRRVGALIELRILDIARTENDQVLADALSSDDRVTEAGARRAQGLISQAIGDMSSARLELGEAIELFRELDDQPQLAETLRLRGFLELFGGSLAEAEWLFGEATDIYTRLEDRRGLGYLEQHRAWMAFLGGHLDEAEKYLGSAAKTLEELGDRTGVGWAFGLLAYVKFFGRDFVAAEDLADRVRTEAKERGDEWAEAMMTTLLGSIRLWTGHLDAAQSFAEQARLKFKRLNDGFGLAQALSVLGRAQIALGDPGIAKTTEALLSSAMQFGQSPYPYLAVAGIVMHGGDGKTAIAMADEAIARMNSMESNPSEAYIIKAVGLVQIGDYESAQIALDQVEGRVSNHPFARAAGALVAALEARPAQAIAAAEEVAAAEGHSYLDGVIACIGAGAACAIQSDSDQARRWLDDAVQQAVAPQDVVATALSLLAFEHVLGFAHDRGSGDLGALGAGWRSVIDSLPHLQLAAGAR